MKKYKTVIIISILIALGVIYYYYLAAGNKTTHGTKKSGKSDTELVLDRNLEQNYPATPREVVEYYSQILVCCYGEKHSDEEIEKIAAQSLKLFDEELVARNPIDSYTENLKNDIAQYKEEKKKITTYIVEKSSDIEYKTFQSHYYAKVECAYYVKGEGETSRTLETYTLRKDSSGKWKILLWTLTPTEENGQ